MLPIVESLITQPTPCYREEMKRQRNNLFLPKGQKCGHMRDPADIDEDAPARKFMTHLGNVSTVEGSTLR